MTIQEYIEEKARVLLVPGVGIRYLTEEDVINLYSHIIQKDIERMEGMEWKINERDKGESLQEKLGHNEVLQTLIEIKRKELEELNNK